MHSLDRGAVLVSALPWLRSLLLQHASGIMSQESSLIALNSLYQVRSGNSIEITIVFVTCKKLISLPATLGANSYGILPELSLGSR